MFVSRCALEDASCKRIQRVFLIYGEIIVNINYHNFTKLYQHEYASFAVIPLSPSLWGLVIPLKMPPAKIVIITIVYNEITANIDSHNFNTICIDMCKHYPTLAHYSHSALRL